MVSPQYGCACALPCDAPVRKEKIKLKSDFHTLQLTNAYAEQLKPFHKLSDLTARIVTLVTLEAFLIFVGLLMLDESIALMEHRITVTTLSALLNVGMLLTEVHTCNGHK